MTPSRLTEARTRFAERLRQPRQLRAKPSPHPAATLDAAHRGTLRFTSSSYVCRHYPPRDRSSHVLCSATPHRPASAPGEAEKRSAIRRAIGAGSVGNFVEQFDYGLYGYMAPIMAPAFFPESDRTVAVLGTYAIIAIACLVRPLGGTLLGRWGDRLGRRKTLLWSLVAMGTATALVAVLPTYHAVGILAPLLLLALRVVQGVVSGGEYVGAVAFIVEWAEPNRRAYYTSYASNSCFVGTLAGAGVAALTSWALPDEALYSWGWRLPFLLAIPLSLVGLWMRRRIEESPEFVRATEDGTDVVKSPIIEALRTQWRPILVYCGISIMLAILSYTWVTFYPQYLTDTLGLPRWMGLASNAISIAVLIPFLPLVSKLSDRIGRKPMLLMGRRGLHRPGAARLLGGREGDLRGRRGQPAHLPGARVLPDRHRHGLRGRTLLHPHQVQRQRHRVQQLVLRLHGDHPVRRDAARLHLRHDLRRLGLPGRRRGPGPRRRHLLHDGDVPEPAGRRQVPPPPGPSAPLTGARRPLPGSPSLSHSVHTHSHHWNGSTTMALDPVAYLPYKDPDDFIREVTDRIWVARDIAHIVDNYEPDSIVHASLGTVVGRDGVIEGSTMRMASSPGHVGQAEDVVWEARGTTPSSARTWSSPPTSTSPAAATSGSASAPSPTASTGAAGWSRSGWSATTWPTASSWASTRTRPRAA
ncbi:MFS transporter [Streptomyces albus]|nr:MFS transporter [Streptomyces albus]